MGGDEKQLSGPDLTQGIPFRDIADGAMLLGHAGGEPVLVARRGDEMFAISAVCTHYGGPLAEGLLVDDTVRCPWHHACFSLRTGEALRAPALNPVTCWRTERRGDTVYVTDKLEHEPLAPSGDGPWADAAPPASRLSMVIVGAGAAGHAAAEMLRRGGHTGRIILLGADESVPYDRPNLSKDYLAGKAPEEWIPLRPREFYEEHVIELVLGTHASAIDITEKRVVLQDGTQHAFDVLLLAMGADPVRLDVAGAGGKGGAQLPHVHYLRTLADSRAIIAKAKDAGTRRAVMIGASFIGLEVAASLRARDIEVHVVAPEARPLERVMGPQLGDFLRALHESHGVVFHLEQTVTGIGSKAVTLKNGQAIPADLVVIGIGVRPVVALAQAAGLAIDRGVVVNEYLETSAPGIFAAGDIARWPDPHTGERIRVAHWVVAQRQGQTAARNMLGGRERFDAVPFFWSQHYDLAINYVGHAERWDRIDIDGSIEGKDCTVAFRAGEKTLAVATLFRDRENLEAEVMMERDDQEALARLGRV